MRAKILVVNKAVGSKFGVKSPLHDDQHDEGTADTHTDRRGVEGDDDAGDVGNHQVGQDIDAAEKDLELIDASVE